MVAGLRSDPCNTHRLGSRSRPCRSNHQRGAAMRTEVIDYDDTPSGHSFAAAWWTLSGFGVLAGVLLIGLAGEAAIYNLFG